MKKFIFYFVIVMIVICQVFLLSGCLNISQANSPGEKTSEISYENTKETTDDTLSNMPVPTSEKNNNNKETSGGKSGSSHPVQCQIYKNDIYFSDGGLKKISFTNTNPITINEKAKSFNIYSDYLFYTADDGLYIKDLKNNKDEKICEDNYLDFKIGNQDSVFFYNANNSKGYVYNINNKNLTAVNSFKGPRYNFFGMDSNYIYVQNTSSNTLLKYNFNTDKTEELNITNKAVSCCLYENKIYCLSENSEIIFLDSDGKNEKTLISNSNLNNNDILQTIEIKNNVLYVKYKNSLETYSMDGKLKDTFNWVHSYSVYNDLLVYKYANPDQAKNYIICKGKNIDKKYDVDILSLDIMSNDKYAVIPSVNKMLIINIETGKQTQVTLK